MPNPGYDTGPMPEVQVCKLAFAFERKAFPDIQSRGVVHIPNTPTFDRTIQSMETPASRPPGLPPRSDGWEKLTLTAGHPELPGRPSGPTTWRPKLVRRVT